MTKRKINENVIEKLHSDLENEKRSNSKLYSENIKLKQDISTLKEVLTTLVQDESLWCEDQVKKTSIISRLKYIISSY